MITSKLLISGVIELLKETRIQVRMKVSKRTVLYDQSQRRRSFQLSKRRTNVLKVWLKSSARNIMENLLPCSFGFGLKLLMEVPGSKLYV